MKSFKIISLLLAILFLASCQTNTASDDEALETVEVMLDWYPNAVHTFLYVAIENGYFAEEGLDVDIVFPTNPTDPIQLTASGAIPLALSYQPDVILARSKDLPVVSVASVVRSPLNHVMFLAEQDFDSPADLVGLTVGYPGIPVNEPILKTMVEAAGGDYEQVHLMDVGFELGASIVSGRADAVVGTYINHEYPVLKHEGHDISYFNPVDYGVPEYDELVLISNEAYVEESGEVLAAFWRAASKGYEWMVENPDEALNVLLTNQDEANFPLIQEVEEESLSILLEKMENPNGPFGGQDAESWEEVISWLDAHDWLEQPVVAEDAFSSITD
ncbi:ABC transporter substrate-binding protein [Halalkalibacterium halodurans]|uniref:ABC transporter substrate-binding protein n=1 Tax=Halalkalibacterium halodurans TaxID=86665 RepID=A0A0M0KJH6_ALKHA|nr:ABC transporter substrate-binding protein [Halalkalibacterium halodurans]MED3646276.1 ABC transporter substrate-binding protein [Halalkalibacterium halodurans]MED4163166.1 ABC transporter substrate-binding protein [Halalkalibacterium halodurans]TES55846.1 ABC transporter substrate-binding protein [Halalkalibacterium halodurans]TPE69447.1 ABC transporter substrate-binding protein [Halalkalibacterium halodurans]